jgi:hypothetical protein
MMDSACTRWPEDQGVSEAIGFLLIFTMVIVGIGLVTLYGYPMLLQQQITADEKIMEKNMIVLQNDEKSITYKTIPYKETSLKIGSGALEVHNQSDTAATFQIYDADTSFPTVTFHPGDLRYVSDSADTDISLQNGAVIKRQHVENGSAMIAEPRWFVDDTTNTVVINLIAINSSAPMSRAGIGTVQMGLGQVRYSYYVVGINDQPLMVKYTPGAAPDTQDYSVAWGDYFTQSLPMASTGVPGEYKFIPNGKTIILVIKTFEVVINSV